MTSSSAPSSGASRPDPEQPGDQLERCERALRERDEFLSLIAHDLRTPLTSIRGYAQLLRRGRSSAHDRALAAGLDVIVHQADRLAELTGQLLDVARINTGRVALRRAAVDLVQIVREASEEVANESRAATIELDADGPLVLSADGAQLRRACRAVLGFAATRAQANPPVQARLTADRHYALLAVDDTGPLMAPEEAARLYANLVVAPAAGSALALGWIELYVARGLVESHGGRVTVQSPVPGSTHGARQSLWLPVRDPGESGELTP